MSEKKPSWPYKTDGELRAAGYVYETTRRCYGKTCGATIEIWRTPGGKTMPIDPGTMEPHWANCPDRDDF